MELQRSLHGVLRQRGRDLGELLEARGRRLGAFLNTAQNRRDSLGRGVVRYRDDGSCTNAGVLVLGQVDGRINEVANIRFIEHLQGGADLGDWQCVEHKLGDDTKVIGTALQRPKEIGIGRSIGNYLATVTQNHVVAHNVVHGKAVLVGQVVEATNQAQTGYSNGLHAPSDAIQIVGIESCVYVDPLIAWPDLDHLIISADVNFFEVIEGE